MVDREFTVHHSEIISYYETIDERSRLTRGAGLLELVRMQELIQRFLPAPPKVGLDVGGGPGRYSCWLARMGYEVHLVDVVDKHVGQARAASVSQVDHPLASVTLGDARSLAHEDGSVDFLLLMGPLYHITDRSERLVALREARRVLKSGGTLIATAISRHAILMDGLRSGILDDPAFVSILSRDLADGQHRNDSDNLGYFTTAFFHRPEELQSEVVDAGFDLKGLFSVQGPGEFTKDLEARMLEPAKRAQLLGLIRAVEQEKTLLGVGSHFIIVASK